MRVVDQGGRYKRDTDFSLLPEGSQMNRSAPFAPPTAGFDVLRQAVRRKTAFPQRGR
jgi:hypothetical protein